MKFLPILLTAVLCLAGCATPVAPSRLQAPSVRPAQAAVEQTVQHLDLARTAAQQVQASITKATSLAGENKELKATLALAATQVDTLTHELLNAKDTTTITQAALAKLDSDGKAQIADANRRLDGLNREIAKMTPVYKEVTSKWGIGAILFGFRTLATHLLILGAVVAGLGGAVYGLSFCFPVLGIGLKAAGALLGRAKALVVRR